MKYHVLLLVLAVSRLAAQTDSKAYSTYTWDVNGHRNEVSSSTVTGPYQAQTMRSINGRQVPTETVEETVISEGPGGRVVERVIRRFDQNGQPAAEERHRIEEQKLSADRTVVNTTIYEKDINGNLAVRERMVTDKQISGEVERSETRVERPDINGGFGLQETQLRVATGDEKDRHVDVTVLRPNTNGRLEETERQVVDTKVLDNQTTSTAVTYKTAVTGEMQVTGQNVTRTVRNADGTESQIVDVYGPVLPGRSINANREGLQLREQQLIEKTLGPNNTVTETYSVRRVNLDTGTLGEARKISETVCTGNCLPPPPPPAKPQAEAEQARN
jgi:hypothetical protein